MTQRRKLQGIFLCIFISLAITVSAQVNYDEVVYLKNGSIIHGTIIELVPNESIKIKTTNNDVILFKLDEVEKITREDLKSEKHHRLEDNEVKSRGLTNIIEFLYAGGAIVKEGAAFYPGNFPSLGFITVNGYMFNPHLFTGIGLGIQGYDEIGFVPIFADVKYYVVKGTMTPFVSFDAGYSFSTNEIATGGNTKFRGGAYSNLSIGMKFFTKKSQALAFS